MKIIILSFVVTFMVIMLFKSTIDLIDRVKRSHFYIGKREVISI